MTLLHTIPFIWNSSSIIAAELSNLFSLGPASKLSFAS